MSSAHVLNAPRWDGPALMDIIASSTDEYEEKTKVLPIINKEFSILKNKRKVEPAGFMFYVKYEIQSVWGNQKSKTYTNRLNIEEIFLYKDKVNLLQEMESKDGGYASNKDKKKRRNDDNDSESSNGNDHDGKDSKKKEKTFKKGTSLVKKYIADNVDLYEILGVEESDGLDKVKANYKKLILIFHPDKSKGTAALHSEKKKEKMLKEAQEQNSKNKEKINSDTKGEKKTNEQNDLMYYMENFKVEQLSEEEKKAMFLKIQDAYTILSDADLRKQYDSSVPFDETVPTAKDLEMADSFYDFLRPIFKRNAKWSVVKPVPDIGDENTDIKTVKQFYDFWYSFTSWRDFSCQNEYDYEQAECREERRWMEKENKKIQKKASRLENLRILKLVDLAFQRDPRLIAEKQRIKLEKEKKKQEQALLEKQKKMEWFNQTTNKKTHPNSGKNGNASTANNGNDVNSNLTAKEKMALKVWKYHIKSVGYIKLTHFVKTEMLADKLTTIPFEVMCDFIYDIYLALNFDCNNIDEIAQERRNQKNVKINEKEMQQDESAFVNGKIGDLQGSETINGKEDTNMVNCSKMDKETINQNDAAENGNGSNIKNNNMKKGFSKSNSKNYVNKKNNRNKNNNYKQSADSNKSAGFLDMIKNKQLTQEELFSLLQVFKKYIPDAGFFNENYTLPKKSDSCAPHIQTEESKATQDTQKREVTSASVSTEETINNSLEKKEHLNDQKKEVETLEKKLATNEHETEAKYEAKQSQEVNNNNNVDGDNDDHNDDSLKWNAAEVSLLAKALKIYPGGTKDRWNLIANQLKTKNVKEVIRKAKEMFENETLKNLGKKFDETPFDHFKQANKGVMKKIDDELDRRTGNQVDGHVEHSGEMYHNSCAADDKTSYNNHDTEGTTKGKPWTEDEQDLLEKALVKYPSTIPIKERLKLISVEIPTRTSEEIVTRLKQIRAKILAQKAGK